MPAEGQCRLPLLLFLVFPREYLFWKLMMQFAGSALHGVAITCAPGMIDGDLYG